MIVRFILVLSTLLVSACTEVQYAAHMSKELGGTLGSYPPAGQQGNFKVGKPYKVEGRTYTPREQYDLVETGIASWYGPGFHGKSTANGEKFDKHELTAAHRTLQMPSLVRVTNLDNGRSVIVRINDRGPFKRGRIIDVSEKAAELLGFKNMGTAKVKLEVLQQESLRLAQLARQGAGPDTYKAAMAEPVGYEQPAYQTASLDSVSRQSLTAPSDVGAPVQTALPGHMRDGAFYPDPVVMERPVTPTRIYVQAGSFGVYDNALRLRDQLTTISNATVQQADVRGQIFYRVRLGPAGSVEEADELLSRVLNAGQREAIIVVE